MSAGQRLSRLHARAVGEGHSVVPFRRGLEPNGTAAYRRSWPDEDQISDGPRELADSRRQLGKHLEFLERFEATVAAGEAVVAPTDRENIQSSIADFRLYLALTESDVDEQGPSSEPTV